MYDTLKIKLIFMVINGCKFGQWHMFNIWCKDKLTSREYAAIKRTREYKTLMSYFKEI